MGSGRFAPLWATSGVRAWTPEGETASVELRSLSITEQFGRLWAEPCRFRAERICIKRRMGRPRVALLYHTLVRGKRRLVWPRLTICGDGACKGRRGRLISAGGRIGDVFAREAGPGPCHGFLVCFLMAVWQRETLRGQLAYMVARCQWKNACHSRGRKIMASRSTRKGALGDDSQTERPNRAPAPPP